MTNFVGVQNDVTERIRAEEILSEIRRAERRRIARDLHDIVLQDLSGALQSLRLTHLQAKKSGMSLDFEEELEAPSGGRARACAAPYTTSGTRRSGRSWSPSNRWWS
jgi:hypothetical protein